jgi:simple sugar transport system permease protein
MTSRVEDHAQVPAEQSQTLKIRLTGYARKNGLQLGIIGVFLVMWVFFVVAAPGTFLAKEIYAALMSTIPFFGVIALPLTMVVIAGEMDLSFPSIMAIGMTAFAVVFAATESLELSLLVCLSAGFLAGLLNGIIVVKLGIPSLIATIGTMFFWRGVVLVITQGSSKTFFEARGTDFRGALVGRTAGYLPRQMIWMVLVAIVVWFLLNRHKFGAHVYLVGDNENSARLMGVNVDRIRILIFAVVGLAAALGGALASMEVFTFFPTLGEGYLMRTLAAVFLGGTSVFGGTGTILGTFVGCFIIGAIEPGIVAIGLTGFWTQLIYGLIITVSVAMHAFLRRRME